MTRFRLSARAAAVSAVVCAATVLVPLAQPSTAETSSFSSLRLVDPAPTALNSYDLTFDARNNKWIQYYTPGLRALFTYRNVGSTFSLTFEAKDKNGTLLTNTPVYLIVNKNWSCSDGKYTTDVDTFYEGTNRADARHIVADWCGDHQEFFGGETSIPGTTNASGRVTFTLTNINDPAEAEVAPVAKNVINTYTPGNLRYLEDPLSLGSTIAPSFTKHPRLADDNGEDKDLLFVHLVNPALKAEQSSSTALSSSASKTVRFRAVDLEGNPKANIPVSLVQMSGPDEASIAAISGTFNAGIVSTVTDANGWVAVTAQMSNNATGDQEIVAKIDDTRVSAKAIVTWVNASVPTVSKAASISGRAGVGATLTVAKGTWTGSPTISYAWAVCTISGKSAAAMPTKCSFIKGATKSTYKVTAANRGKYIRVRVRGVNIAGTATSVSASTAKVQ